MATADSVIVYDSDWNPQSDVQAIDRVHRIGQTKQVRVFRLVTENTIDERIVQRAEIKLRLDRMVIGSGHMVQSSAEKKAGKEAMNHIIRIDAEHILSDNCEEIIDVDIEQILRDGTVKTNAENAKFAQMKQEEMRKYTLEEASSTSLYNFEGIDYRQLTSAPVETMPAIRPTRYHAKLDALAAPPSAAKLITLQEYQFFPPAIYLFCVPGTFKIDMNTQTGEMDCVCVTLHSLTF